MSLQACRECGTEVSTAADKCQKCGIKFPAPSTYKRRRNIIAAGVVTALILCAFDAFMPSGNQQQSQQAAPPVHPDFYLNATYTCAGLPHQHSYNGVISKGQAVDLIQSYCWDLAATHATDIHMILSEQPISDQ